MLFFETNCNIFPRKILLVITIFFVFPFPRSGLLAARDPVFIRRPFSEINETAPFGTEPPERILLPGRIITDTGSFKFPRTDSETHNIAAKLIEWGADPFEIYSEVYDRSSIGRLKLLSRFLGSLTFAHDNKVIYAFVCLKDFEETGTNQYDTEVFIHHMMSIDTVQVGIIFTETRSGVKISFRSKGDIYVNELAKEFGGGGHKTAAGSFISGKIDHE